MLVCFRTVVVFEYKSKTNNRSLQYLLVSFPRGIFILYFEMTIADTTVSFFPTMTTKFIIIIIRKTVAVVVFFLTDRYAVYVNQPTTN